MKPNKNDSSKQTTPTKPGVIPHPNANPKPDQQKVEQEPVGGVGTAGAPKGK